MSFSQTLNQNGLHVVFATEMTMDEGYVFLLFVILRRISLNTFTPKSDQIQIFPAAASLEI